MMDYETNWWWEFRVIISSSDSIVDFGDTWSEYCCLVYCCIPVTLALDLIVVGVPMGCLIPSNGVVVVAELYSFVTIY